MILWLLVLVLIEDEAMLQSSSKGIDPPGFNFLNVHGDIDIRSNNNKPLAGHHYTSQYLSNGRKFLMHASTTYYHNSHLQLILAQSHQKLTKKPFCVSYIEHK